MNEVLSEAERLERLWGGEFGDEYVDRNADAYAHRERFWSELLSGLGCRSALEIGSNVGGNLRWIAQHVSAESVVGVDINRKALAILRDAVPGVQALYGSARELPVPNASVDLAFTMGVLIHQPEESLPQVMDEMVRVARRWVLCGEYYDTETTEIHYRGHDGALFRRDYGGLFAARFPDRLRLVRQGFLGRDEGWDDITWWLFERTG